MFMAVLPCWLLKVAAAAATLAVAETGLARRKKKRRVVE
jgi:hypothetical protein